MKKDREKKSVKKSGHIKEEKDLRKADTGLDEEDEVTMSFMARKLKDSCSD